MRRFIVCCLLLLSTRIFAEIKTPILQITTDYDDKWQVRYDDERLAMFDLDEAMNDAMTSRYGDYYLSSLDVEPINAWGFTMIIERLLREHKYLAVHIDDIGVFAFYNIDHGQILVATYKKRK